MHDLLSAIGDLGATLTPRLVLLSITAIFAAAILRGISQDLPEKLAAVRAATTLKAQDLALRDMVYLLNDNVEVITAPPRPAA